MNALLPNVTALRSSYEPRVLDVQVNPSVDVAIVLFISYGNKSIIAVGNYR